jgi:DNA-binding NarL/FixJ family response regulator
MDDLTPREVEVLTLICNGHSSRQIAGQLGIAVKTAACHRHRILGKVGVRNAVGLLRWAIRQGYVTVDVEQPSEPPAGTSAAKPAS